MLEAKAFTARWENAEMSDLQERPERGDNKEPLAPREFPDLEEKEEYQVKGDYQELMVQRVRLAHLVREVLLVKRELKVQLEMQESQDQPDLKD